MKTLVIVESPKKIKIIKKILGENYEVVATVGHILDLDPKRLSIEIENNYKPIYKQMTGKSSVIKNIKNAEKKCKEIMIATDKDREGEMIGWSIVKILKIKEPKRMIFTSVTKEELKKALENPQKLDNNMVDAQKARRILDRIVGYMVSPLLWKNIKGKSAGRVQSVVTRLIIDKEKEIEEFIKEKKESIYKCKGEFEDKEGEKITGQLYKESKKEEICKIKEKKEIKKIIKKHSESEMYVKHKEKKKKEINPSEPFTTSSLQQEANRKLNYGAKRTATVSQRLYEKGLITYIRTDSINLSNEALKKIKEYITKKHGKKYYREKKYENKKNNTQEAHEAIRPTDIEKEGIEDIEGITNDEVRLYKLIWRRTIASQMIPAIYDIEKIKIGIKKDKKRYYMTIIENIKELGYKKIYNVSNEEKKYNIPEINEEIKKTKIIGKEEYKEPPSRYNEASLIKIMDPKKLNIGRPATYPSIIEKIKDREYVKISDIEGIKKKIEIIEWEINKGMHEKENIIEIGKEKNKFIPTELGKRVTEYLIKNFDNIMDYKFTADMENELDKIAEGKVKWTTVIDKFYKEFNKNLIKIEENENNNENNENNEKYIGEHPETKNKIYACIAKYGPVIKMKEKGTKIKYAPIKEPMTIETINIEQAIKLLEYPKILGKYERKNIILQKGKYGTYIKYDNKSYNTNNIENITLEKAIEIIENKRIKPLYKCKEGKITYEIREGPYGKYININEKKKIKNIKFPENEKIENISAK